MVISFEGTLLMGFQALPLEDDFGWGRLSSISQITVFSASGMGHRLKLSFYLTDYWKQTKVVFPLTSTKESNIKIILWDPSE